MWKTLFNGYHAKLGNIKARARENLWCVTETILLTLSTFIGCFTSCTVQLRGTERKKLDRKLLILGPALGNRQPQFEERSSLCIIEQRRAISFLTATVSPHVNAMRRRATNCMTCEIHSCNAFTAGDVSITPICETNTERDNESYTTST